MSENRRVWLARLPEMRFAYFELDGEIGAVPQLWERLNAWRLANRPVVGRVDIAQVGWLLNPTADDPDQAQYRACLPVRSDYEATGDVRTTFFPGGLFAYCAADDFDEVESAFEQVERWLEEQGGWTIKSAFEVYRYHFNLEQHPADCGFHIERA